MTAQRTPEYAKKYRAENKDKIRKTRNAWEREIRKDVIRHYGGRCVCCRERMVEFLRVVPKPGASKPPEQRSIYYWLKKQGLPPGYEVYCENCKTCKEHNGYCPHKDGVI